MAHRSLAVCAALAVAVATSGCSYAGGTGATQAAKPATVVRDRNVITQAELQQPDIRDLNVLEVVQRLRPTYLTVRGLQSLRDTSAAMRSSDQNESGKVHASFDGVVISTLDDLTTVYARSIAEIRYLDAGAAMQRFGPRAFAGPVILVLTNAK